MGDTGISRHWVVGSHDLAEFLLVLGFSLKMNMPYEIIDLQCCYVLGREEMFDSFFIHLQSGEMYIKCIIGL